LLSGYLVSILVFSGIYAIAAIGLSLLAGVAGQVSLGQAAFFGIGAYTSALLATRLQLSPWLGLVAAGGGWSHRLGDRRPAAGAARSLPGDQHAGLSMTVAENLMLGSYR
jgi:branched-subunit amino acid ABC-type transport system permease component